MRVYRKLKSIKVLYVVPNGLQVSRFQTNNNNGDSTHHAEVKKANFMYLFTKHYAY